jgi:uncharacterized repeat protein (TIGR03806 family)
MKPLAFLLAACLFLFSEDSALAQLTRENNTTLKFPAAPSSTAGQFELADLLPGAQFDKPVCVATPPGETRLFVVERFGRIWVINDIAHPAKQLFMDISFEVNASDWQTNRRTEGLSSIAFHPNFGANHRFFVTYNTITTTAAGSGHHNRVAEFRASDDNASGIISSEIPMITQYDEGDGHNINDLHFGPDGYLYIATGDEGDGGTGDDFNNAQKIDKDFFSAIMRIDVDKKAGNLTPNAHPSCNQNSYKIPADNPFVGATSFNGLAVNSSKVRTEFFAVGLRNPWRFSFDPQTGKIYEGDVGQHSREEINVIVKAGNYGWSFREGTLNGPKAGSALAGFNSIPPIFEYDTDANAHSGFSGYSVTGGVVYRGNRLPGLNGSLVFADYVSGNIWAMNVDQQPYPRPTRLFGESGIAGFGYDPRNGDVLLVNHDTGKIRKIQYSVGEPDNLPTSLDQTGIFADLASLRPNAGIYPYDVNVPLWSDDAIKRRWFSIPAGKQIHFDGETNWTFPSGSVWIKHFELETRLGDPSTAVRVETRVLVKNDSGLYGLSYKWDTNGANAYLVPDGGDIRGIAVNLGATSRRQIWRFPSRSECLTCHTVAGGQILGFNTPQLNRDYGYGSVTTNQIGALANAGFLENPPIHPQSLRALAPLDDESISREYRVRSYLFANCGQCHQPAGNVYAAWDSRITTPTSRASIVWGQLLNSSGPNDKVVTPGATNTSAIIKRMTSFGTERMPPLASSVLDRKAVQLISDWIVQDLPQFQTYSDWAKNNFGGNIPDENGDNDNDGVLNYAEYLMNSNPLDAAAPVFPTAVIQNDKITLTFNQPANRGVFFEWTDDFPANAWSLAPDPQNKLLFPAQTTTRTITDEISGAHKYYRMRIVEP